MTGAPRLKQNLALLYGAEAASKLLGLAVFGYLGRTLGAERYGDLELSIGILSLLVLVQDAGLPAYAARESARDPGRIGALAGQLFLIRSLVLVFSLCVLALLSLALPGGGAARTLVLLYGLVLVPTPLDVAWSFQARDDMRVVALSSLVRQLVLFAGTFALVRAPEHVTRVPLFDAAGLTCAVVLQQALFRAREGAIALRQRWSALRAVVIECLPIAASAVVWALRIYAPLIALGFYLGSAPTGVFGASHRLVVSLHTFVWLYFFNLLPSISRVAAQSVAYRRLIHASALLVAWLAAFGACLGTVLAPWLIPLVYGDGLSAAAEPFAITVWMLLAAFLSGHHRFSLIAFRHQKDELLAAVAGAVVSVGGCVALGVALSPVRAAWLLLAAEVATLLAADRLFRRRGVTLELARLLSAPATAAAASLALCAALRPPPGLSAAIVLALFALFSVRSLAGLRAGFRELQVSVRPGRAPEGAASACEPGARGVD